MAEPNGYETTPLSFPADVTIEDDDVSIRPGKLRDLVCVEARSVSVWSICAILLRIFMALIARLAVQRESSSTTELYRNFAALAGWALGWMPNKVFEDKAPGFVFASAWLLFGIRDTCGSTPNVPIRICEMVLGRLTLRELFIVLPIHFVCALSNFMLFKHVLPSQLSSLGLAPILYSVENPWIVDLVREIVVNAAFTVSFLVLPEILSLNKFPRWLAMVGMYPIYSYQVDASEKGSTFGPNVLYALASAHRSEGLGQSISRFSGSILGGLVGGKIMHTYFPDEPTI